MCGTKKTTQVRSPLPLDPPAFPSGNLDWQEAESKEEKKEKVSRLFLVFLEASKPKKPG